MSIVSYIKVSNSQDENENENHTRIISHKQHKYPIAPVYLIFTAYLKMPMEQFAGGQLHSALWVRAASDI